MPTHAFFLCNDEKALEAVSQVLNELAVSFDLFKEPSVAVKRLASQHFDMILVDCDNEQTAAQLLSSAKNSSFTIRPSVISPMARSQAWKHCCAGGIRT